MKFTVWIQWSADPSVPADQAPWQKHAEGLTRDQAAAVARNARKAFKCRAMALLQDIHPLEIL